ncbi:nSTAND1 domain-containing NTPase [Streptomyces sp. NPDC000851]
MAPREQRPSAATHCRLRGGPFLGQRRDRPATRVPGASHRIPRSHRPVARTRPRRGRLSSVHERRPAAHGRADTVLIVGQFEEVFTLCRDPEERAEFVRGCCDGARLRVVVAIRADFHGRCAEHPGLVEALNAATLLLGSMSPEQVREAVVKPAAGGRLVVERALTARIVADVAQEPGALPLMSHALLELWRRRRARTLTLEAYEAFGRVQGAVAHTAEAVFAGFGQA